MMSLQLLKDIDGVEVELEKDLTNFSTMKLKASGTLITVKKEESLPKVLETLNENKINYNVLGMGANQLLFEKSKNPYLLLNFPFDKSYLNEVREVYELPASVRLAVLTAHASKFGLIGWEVFTGVPASLGGAIFMNAGTNLGEIGSLVKEVFIAMPNGETRIHKVGENSFKYRKNNFLAPGEVIYRVSMVSKGQDPKITTTIREYLAKRNATQPMREATCGCVFKNYKRLKNGEEETCRAGQCIDIIGMKGFQYKNLRVSPIHANFMENLGGATATDVLEFIKIIQEKVEEKFGFVLETEVQFQKDNNE